MKTDMIHKKNEPPAYLADRASAQVARDDGEIEQRIAARAYELYSERGCHDRHDLDNWLEAEQAIVDSEAQPEKSGSSILS